jgi:hypothetical protein
MDIASFSLEVAVIAHLDIDYQIARRASFASMTLFSYSKIYSIINTFRNVNGLFGRTVSHSSSTAGHARIPNYLAYTIAVAAHLLNHKWALTNSLEALTTTASTS